MPLDPIHLQYPHRRYGYDQPFTRWSMLPQRAPVRFPDGNRLALVLVVPVRFFPLDASGKPFRPLGAVSRPYPDLWNFSARDYGNRVGIFRFFEVLDRLGLRAAAAVQQRAAERMPVLVEEAARRNWEIVAHGVDMATLHAGELDPVEERGLIDGTLGTLRHLSGQPVRGWISPAGSQTIHTLDLLASSGLQWNGDWQSDDMPVPLHTNSGRIWSFPVSREYDDTTILMEYHHREEEWEDQVLDACDVFLGETAEQGGRILTLTITPYLLGLPFRIGVLERALERIVNTRGVWNATPSEILDAVETQLPPE